MAGVAETIEMAALDKEMAEEKVGFNLVFKYCGCSKCLIIFIEIFNGN